MAILSTVFSRGAIGSRPSATTAGYHYFATDEGILYRDTGSAWEAVSSRGLAFAFSTTTTDGDPGAGTIRFDSATPASVTVVRIDDVCLNSDADLSTAWAAVSGARLLITQADDPAKHLLGEVTAVADGTGYYNLTVTVDASGTLPDDGALLNVQVLGGGGGGGGSSGNWWDNRDEYSVICEQYFGRGGIEASFGLDLVALGAATTDGPGFTGSDGFTEDDVLCNWFGDVSPANGGLRQIACPADNHSRADVGHYWQSYVRCPQPNDNTLYIGLIRNDTFVGSTSNIDRMIFMKRSTDTNWQALSTDNTAQEITDTGVAWADEWVNFEGYMYDDGGTMTCKFWINGTLVATHTTRCPRPAENDVNWTFGSKWTDTDIATYSQVMFVNRLIWRAQNPTDITSLTKATL